MKKENCKSEEKNENNIENGLTENINNQENQENIDKTSSMSQIKNMFNLKENNNHEENNNTFHNSLKLFKKKNINSNPEAEKEIQRTKSNKNINLNNKNFPSKANIFKGNINVSTNILPIKSSPIVQYYNSVGTPSSLFFNYSPSDIFNTNNKDNIGSNGMSVKPGENIEPIYLNRLNDNDDDKNKNFEENFEYETKFDDNDNYEIKINYKKEENKIGNEKNKNKTNSENLNNNDDNNIEENNEKNGEIYQGLTIQNAMKKLKRKSKYAKNLNNEIINNGSKDNINNIKEEKNEEIKQKEYYEKNQDILAENQTKFVLNNLDDENIPKNKNEEVLNNNNENIIKGNLKFIYDEKYDDINQNELKLNSQANNLNNYNFIGNNNKSYRNIGNFGPNSFNYSSNITQNYNNKINDNINNNPNNINNNFNNVFNNPYIQFNPFTNNYTNNIPPNFNLPINNEYNKNLMDNCLINNYFTYNSKINSINNMPQRMNHNTLNSLNNDFINYNRIIPNTSNINIQNNYFLYNNNGLSNNNNLNEEEEKPKKKKKKKVKKLEQSIYMNKPLSYYLDNFATIAKDQGASRYLQDLLNNYSETEINYFFEPLCKNILQIIDDPFANYLIQKIICFFDQDQLLKLLKIIAPSFFQISCAPHGTRVLQKLIELLKSPEIKSLFFELVKPNVAELLKDLNGTYIVQKFAYQNINDYGAKLNLIIIENSVELCTYRHGCCVIQKYIETRDRYILHGLINKLLEGFSTLITDQFGNYVIKTILFLGNYYYSNIIGEKISLNILYYSRHKYSSNVVEKCFEYCQGAVLTKLINSIQQEQNIKLLILDEHGNYVVQKVLSISSPKKKREMLYIIKGLFPQLKQTHYGERVIHRIYTTYPIVSSL